jgi:hypothetical protein
MTRLYRDYPSFSGMSRADIRRAVKRADLTIMIDILQFLWDDPLFMGSGYLKEIIWHWITRYELAEQTISFLEQVALRYLKRPLSREFKYMCITMAKIARPAFWDVVRQEMASKDPTTALTASCLFPYSFGVIAGEKARREQRSQRRYRQFYYPAQGVIEVSDLIMLVYDGSNWKNGHVAFRPIVQSELPIVYYDPTQDAKFATLDFEYCIPEIIVPKLKQILSVGRLHTFTLTQWLYILYVFEHLNHPRVVSILEEFLTNKVDVKKFHSVKKAIILSAVFRVLTHHGTPQALELIAARQEDHK